MRITLALKKLKIPGAETAYLPLKNWLPMRYPDNVKKMYMPIVACGRINHVTSCPKMLNLSTSVFMRMKQCPKRTIRHATPRNARNWSTLLVGNVIAAELKVLTVLSFKAGGDSSKESFPLAD